MAPSLYKRNMRAMTCPPRDDPLPPRSAKKTYPRRVVNSPPKAKKPCLRRDVVPSVLPEDVVLPVPAKVACTEEEKQQATVLVNQAHYLLEQLKCYLEKQSHCDQTTSAWDTTVTGGSVNANAIEAPVDNGNDVVEIIQDNLVYNAYLKPALLNIHTLEAKFQPILRDPISRSEMRVYICALQRQISNLTVPPDIVTVDKMVDANIVVYKLAGNEQQLHNIKSHVKAAAIAGKYVFPYEFFCKHAIFFDATNIEAFALEKLHPAAFQYTFVRVSQAARNRMKYRTSPFAGEHFALIDMPHSCEPTRLLLQMLGAKVVCFQNLECVFVANTYTTAVVFNSQERYKGIVERIVKCKLQTRDWFCALLNDMFSRYEAETKVIKTSD